MTVSTTDNVIEYVSGGPAFPIPYRFLQNSDIEAVLVRQNGISETLVLGTQYTLIGAGSQGGGTLTSAYAASVLATPGATLTISRVMDAVQPTDLRNQGHFLAETHESVFDRLTMLIQQGFSILRRALLRPIGKNYYDAQGRQIKNLGDPTHGQDATTRSWVMTQVNSVRDDLTNLSYRLYNQAIAYAEALVAGVVGGYGAFVQYGLGAVTRTFQDKMREQPINIEDFVENIVYVEAPYGPAQVAAATIVDDALAQALEVARVQGRKVELRKRVYRVTKTILPGSQTYLFGGGVGQWLATMNPSIAGGVYKPDMDGSILLMTGNVQKEHMLLGVTDCRTSGGVVPNDNIHDPGYDDSYRMISGYNEDANPVTGDAATPKLFSAAIKLERGVTGCVFKDFRIMKSFDGIQGYHNATIGYGDLCDFGILGDNATDNTFENVQVAGYWQEAGIFFRVGVVGSEGELKTASIEKNKFDNCTAQGLTGFEIRGQDAHRVIGRGANYIDLPWAANHPFDPILLDGRIRSTTGQSFTFTGVSVVSGNLRLTGVSPTPAALPLTAGIVPNLMANGMAKFSIAGCSLTGMDHQSGNRVTAPAMGAFRKTRPSSALNVSGYTLRGLSAPGTKITSQDDVGYHFHWAIDTVLGPKFEIESKDANGLGLGLRLITSPAEGNNTRVANPSGQTFRFVEDTLRDVSDVDHRPVGTEVPSRFPLGNGYLQYNAGRISSIHDRVSNGRFMYPPVGGAAGIGRADGGNAFYTDEATQENRSVRDLRLESNTVKNSTGTIKITVTGNSLGLRGNPVTLSSTDGATVYMRVSDTDWRPGSTDNEIDVGAPTARMHTIYAGTGTINTSDARLKSEVRPFTSAELAVAKALLEEIGMYKFLDSVAEKGDAARWHIGMTVQRAIEIFEAHGLDPFKNAFVCYDQWGDEFETWDAEYRDVPAVIDQLTGQEITPATVECVKDAGSRLVRAAGDLYSFRNDQLALAMLAGVAATQQELEARLAMLEQQ